MSNNEIINIIHSSLLFKDFEYKEIEELLCDSSVSIKKYSKEEVIFFSNDECNNLSIVIHGIVEIQRNDENGNTLVVTTLSSSNMFGENLLFGNKNLYPMDVISKDNSTVLHINKKKVTSLLQENQKLLLSFLALLSNKALLLSEKLKQVSSKSLRNMICEFLLKESKKQNSNLIKLNVTKQALANSFGVQRPSLSRELINMKNENIIDYDRKTITILDFDKIT